MPLGSMQGLHSRDLPVPTGLQMKETAKYNNIIAKDNNDATFTILRLKDLRLIENDDV